MKLKTFEEFVNENKIFKESVLNESASSAEDITTFIKKNEKHFASFLKPKTINAYVEDKKAIIKPASKSFTLIVDFEKSVITTTGKPQTGESTSYVEILTYLKGATKFKVEE